jgi:plasmid maintenance system antidote protein VapI
MSDNIFKDLGLDIKKDPELKRFYCQEKLIFDITELISKLMAEKNINKTKLAELLSVGKSHVTQLLDGTSNMTLRTISDVFTALDAEIAVNASHLNLDALSDSEYETEDENQFISDMRFTYDSINKNWILSQDNMAA